MEEDVVVTWKYYDRLVVQEEQSSKTSLAAGGSGNAFGGGHGSVSWEHGSKLKFQNPVATHREPFQKKIYRNNGCGQQVQSALRWYSRCVPQPGRNDCRKDNPQCNMYKPDGSSNIIIPRSRWLRREKSPPPSPLPRKKRLQGLPRLPRAPPRTELGPSLLQRRLTTELPRRRCRNKKQKEDVDVEDGEKNQLG